MKSFRTVFLCNLSGLSQGESQMCLESVVPPQSASPQAPREKIGNYLIFDLNDRTTPSPALRSGTSPDQGRLVGSLKRYHADGLRLLSHVLFDRQPHFRLEMRSQQYVSL